MDVQIKNLFERGDRVAVALSGGEDSVALFSLLCERESELGIEVLALNVEHGIRGEESASDSRFVKNLCQSAGKRLLFYNVDAPARARERKMSLEAAARELRYECFFSAIENGLCDKVATAHHAGDNAESVLLNLLRGSGVKGLCGMEEVAFSGRVVRPLLGATKEQITAYIAQKRLNFVTDSSNLDNSYTRNFLRNEVLPLIKQRFPEAESALVRMGEISRGESEYLDALAEKLVTGERGRACVRLPDSQKEDRVLLARAVIIAMKTAGLIKDYERAHVDAVLSIAEGEAGSEVSLPHGYVAVKGYGEVIIELDGQVQPFEMDFDLGIFKLPGGTLTVESADAEELLDKKAAFFTQKRQEGVLYACIDGPARLRNRRTGDTFKRYGGGTKPLKEYLIDKKIERRERDFLPVCARGSEVLFVAGVEISDSAAVRDRDQTVYKITYKRTGRYNNV